jgi:pyruvate,water dikinase
LHPAFRRRERAARNALATRIWREDTRRWFDELRPMWIERNRALQAVDPSALDDTALAAHARACYDNVYDGYTQHFELHAPDMLPAGMLLARIDEWNVDRRLLSTALAGASPVSRGEPEPLLRLRALVERAGTKPTSLDEVRAIGPEASAALDAFLDEYGWRLVSSYDTTGLTFGEMPALVLQRIVTSPRPAVDPKTARAAAETLRTGVPEAERAEFDRLLDEVKTTCELRDDNGSLTGAWPSGLVRRAQLECGRRLAATGALHDAAHVFDLDIDELVALLDGGTAPSAAEVEERVRAREAAAALLPPATLGPAEVIPPFTLLPPNIATMGRALVATIDALETNIEASDDALFGTGIGREPYCARALVAHNPEEAIERLEPGDVLVAMFTTPAYNAILPLAGALVVEAGGFLSHAAVMARELDLPAVIGAAGAMATINDGDLVEVDPIAGSVRVMQADPRTDSMAR